MDGNTRIGRIVEEHPYGSAVVAPVILLSLFFVWDLFYEPWTEALRNFVFQMTLLVSMFLVITYVILRKRAQHNSGTSAT